MLLLPKQTKKGIKKMPGKSGSGRAKEFKYNCHYCHEQGHKRADWSKRTQENQNTQQRSAQLAYYMRSDRESEYECLSV